MQETSRRHLFKNRTIGFVPTMGALHAGHLSLIEKARSENDIVAASIFVNPMQFGKGEDFDKYPRDIEGDREKLRRNGVDILFMPEDKSVYPQGFATSINVDGISERLCGAFRPGHFTGVSTVVCKLFNIVRPARAYFGQKDYQQTVIIRRMADDLNMDIEVVVCPTKREDDGLAMSSRNAYLEQEERKAATALYRALTAASHSIKNGASDTSDIRGRMENVLRSEPLISEIQYASVYHTETLLELAELREINLLAIAAKIGNTRLIDNMLVGFSLR